MPSKKKATPISLQPLDALFGTNEETTNGISEIAIRKSSSIYESPVSSKR